MASNTFISCSNSSDQWTSLTVQSQRARHIVTKTQLCYVIIKNPDSLLIYEMFPDHRGIFMYKLLKQKRHELLANWIKLLPVKQKTWNSANRSSFYTLEEVSNGEKEETNEVPAQRHYSTLLKRFWNRKREYTTVLEHNWPYLYSICFCLDDCPWAKWSHSMLNAT